MPSPGSPEINLHDYASAGYYLARLREAGKGRPISRLLPRRYISGSSCLCQFFTDCWVWDNAGPMDAEGNFIEGIRGFQGRVESAAFFGITEEQLPEVIRWGQLSCGRDFGFPRGYYRLIDAHRASEWIHLPREAWVIFGMGLHRTLAEKFLEDMRKHEDHTAALCVREGKELGPGGAPLGHELLNIECGHFCHSWICGGMEEDFAERKQVALNAHGYIESFETARECADMINRREVPSEPPPYYPLLIVEYS